MAKVSTSKVASWSLRFQKTFGAILAAVALVIALLPVFTVSTAHADAPIYSPGNALGGKRVSAGGSISIAAVAARTWSQMINRALPMAT